MDADAHRDLIRKQFALQARAQALTGHLRREERVTPMIELARPRPSDRVLDAACGWGFVLQAFAPHVRSGVGVDLTPEMIELARTLAGARKIANVEFRVGDVEALEFAPGSFEIVTCRASFDHFCDPERALGEMKRVLAPGGRIVLYEYVAPADGEKARRYQEIELLRDPSHVRSSSVEQYEALFRGCGLEERGRVTTLFKRDFEEWMAPVQPDAETKSRTRKLLEDAITGDAAGLGVRQRWSRITFTHKCIAWCLAPRG